MLPIFGPNFNEAKAENTRWIIIEVLKLRKRTWKRETTVYRTSIRATYRNFQIRVKNEILISVGHFSFYLMLFVITLRRAKYQTKLANKENLGLATWSSKHKNLRFKCKRRRWLRGNLRNWIRQINFAITLFHFSQRSPISVQLTSKAPCLSGLRRLIKTRNWILFVIPHQERNAQCLYTMLSNLLSWARSTNCVWRSWSFHYSAYKN